MSLLRSKCCLSYYVLNEREELHGNVAVSYVMLQCNVHKKNSPVIETFVAMTLHVTWSSIPSNSPCTSKSTSMHSCHQHTFELFIFMLVTLYALCFQPSPLTARDVIAEVEKSSVPVYCMTAVPDLPMYCMTVYVAFLQPLKF